MPLATISIGDIENAFQFNTDEFYSDGVTPKGLVVPVAPNSDYSVVRRIDLTGGGVLASSDQLILASRIFGG